MANEKDMEKLALLESIRSQAVHCIKCNLEDCPYGRIVDAAADTIRVEVHADIAREMGIPHSPPKCPAKAKKRKRTNDSGSAR